MIELIFLSFLRFVFMGKKYENKQIHNVLQSNIIKCRDFHENIWENCNIYHTWYLGYYKIWRSQMSIKTWASSHCFIMVILVLIILIIGVSMPLWSTLLVVHFDILVLIILDFIIFYEFGLCWLFMYGGLCLFILLKFTCFMMSPGCESKEERLRNCVCIKDHG